MLLIFAESASFQSGHKVNLNLRSLSRPSGFSLVEVTVGMGVVGILIVVLYGVLTSGFGTVQMDRENLRATAILVEKMDTVRLYSWDQITDSQFIPKKFTAYFDPSNSSGIVYDGRVRISAAPKDLSYASELRQVTVSISWQSPSGRERSREFTTFVARHGLQNYVY